MTLGQLNPGPTGGSCAAADFAQLNVGTGNSYTVPEAGTITQWSHNAAAGAGQMLTMKVLRKVADPLFFKVIGLDTRPLSPSVLNSFQVNIPVQAGDILGLNATAPSTACVFGGVPADTYLTKAGNLTPADAGGSFTSSTGARLNVSAVFEPSNTVTVGSTTSNKKKGTATLNLTLPNPGDLTAAGSGVSASSAGHAQISKAVPAGAAQLLIKATGKKRKTLNQTGKVKLNVTITYTPTNGAPGTQSVKVKLKKK